MNRANTAMGGLAAGAALMYFLDPSRGRRRRALTRDKVARTVHDVSGLLDKATRDVSNRASGAAYGFKGMFTNTPATNQLLEQRVKSKIGRVVSHPHAITVRANGGEIILEGPVLANEVERLMRVAHSVPGVKEVVSRLEVHEHPDHISSLQGGVERRVRSEWNQQRWTPALRVAAGAIGAGMAAYAARARGPLRLASSVAGAALMTRAVANRELREIVGANGTECKVVVDKSITIAAPVNEVFAFWSEYQKFPLFMRHIKEVRDMGEGRSHWIGEGPGGIPVSWDSEITHHIENKLLAWRSVPSSRVQTEGVVRFEETPDHQSRVHIRLSYMPPAGMLGHYVASLFGSDPKREMDEDLVRMKSLIELGRTRNRGHRVTRQELLGHAAGA